jgi:hypothetical protein
MTTETTPLERAITAHATAQQSAKSAKRIYRENVTALIVALVIVPLAIIASIGTLPLALVTFHALIGGACLGLVMREVSTARTHARTAHATEAQSASDLVGLAMEMNA